jgi:hypothetical protein
MPGFTGDALAVLIRFYHEDLGVVGKSLRRIWVDMQFAKSGAECLSADQ